MKHFITALLLLTMFIGAELPHEVEIPEKAYGIWQCCSLGTDTPLYWSEGTGKKYVDMENAACFRYLYDGYLIADHADSEVTGGTWNVNNMRVGEDAFLITADSVKRYECVAIYMVERQTYDYLFNGKPIRPKKNDIVCASCSFIDGVEFVAYYKFVGVEPEY